MPLIEQSSYPGPPPFQVNGHFQTLGPSLFRRVEPLAYVRERVELADGDFIDLDWLRQGSDRLVILTHGLEGNSDRSYIKGMARQFFVEGWDVLAWNCRSCSGEMNRTLRLYHHGDTEDLTFLVNRHHQEYARVNLVGFSLGGSITLKYLGENGDRVPSSVGRSVAFSVPCDLRASVDALEKPANWFYKRKFYRALKAKILIKAEQFPDEIDVACFDKVRTWKDFDEYYSAPLTGFRSADEFYDNVSSMYYLAGIRRPVLLVNAWNDPLLPTSCFPVELARKHKHLFLETPVRGGHVGFQTARREQFWSEDRALEFVNS